MASIYSRILRAVSAYMRAWFCSYVKNGRVCGVSIQVSAYRLLFIIARSLKALN